MKSGATESSYAYLSNYYKFPNNVEVSHLPHVLNKSKKQFKILWAHHAFDQPCYMDFDDSVIDHIVFPSHWAKDNFIRVHKFPKEKTTVIPNGVSDIFEYSKEKTKTFIYTSVPYKGLILLPEIISRIQKIIPDAKFKIFSSMSLYGLDEGNYITVYDRLKQLYNVEYFESVDQKDLVSHYQESAFFIHPNIWEETFCVSMAEAMRCGCYPIITNIGALEEVATDKFSTIVPIDGNRTSTGYDVTNSFINNFADACVSALYYFDTKRSDYNRVSKSASNHIKQKCDWKKISNVWKKLIHKITKGAMTDQNETKKEFNEIISYDPISAEQAVTDNEYLYKAFQNVLRWEESDKELAQGRTNFQLEKFAMLEQHTIPSAYESVLKNRRQMAEGYMFKLIEMKERVRSFHFKWGDVEDKTVPLVRGGIPSWYDLEELALTHYLKSCELEIRDRLYQMEHLDKMLEKLIELNGGVPVTRKQYLDNDAQYWERRFADQAMDEMIAAQTGISVGNLHSMRRASAPALVDERNQLPNGYLPLSKILEGSQGRIDFINDLQRKVFEGIQETTGMNFNLLKQKEEQKKLEDGGYFNHRD